MVFDGMYGMVDFEVGLPQSRAKLPEDLAAKIKVREKPVFHDEEELRSLAAEVAKRLLTRNEIDPASIGTIVYAGSMILPKRLWSFSCWLQHALGAKKAECFDIHNGCLSVSTAINMLYRYVRPQEMALIISADCLSDVVDFDNPEHWSIASFGDSVGAYLVAHRGARYEFVGYEKSSDGRFCDSLFVPFGEQKARSVESEELDEQLSKKYREQYSRLIRRVTRKYGVQLHEIKHFFLNQGDHFLINWLQEEFKVEEGRMMRTHQTLGHAAANDPFIGLKMMEDAGPLEQNTYFIVASSAYGFSWGATLWRKII